MKQKFKNIFPAERKFLSFLVGLILILICTGSFNGCKKDSSDPINPYSKVDYGGNSATPPSPPDPNSIVGIHKNILSVKCAVPGCHDGSFEPDYRTVQSAYSTLVYHPVKKNSPDSSFRFRVVPYDVNKSWLHERLVTENTTLGRMPLYSSPLSQSEMDNINTWIAGGAKDMFGNPAVFPNTEPAITGFFATDSVYSRLDTVRVGGIYYNPFIVKPNSTVKIIVLIEDDSTSTSNLKVNKLKISSNKNDFSNSTSVYAYYLSLYNVWIADVSTSAFPSGSTLYMRYYVNDGNHGTDTEFPTNKSVDGYKTYFAFYVQ